MAHDFNGTGLAVGDLVFIPAKVKSISETQDGMYCNLNVETVHPMPPYEGGTSITLNTRQVILIGKGTFASADD